MTSLRRLQLDLHGVTIIRDFLDGNRISELQSFVDDIYKLLPDASISGGLAHNFQHWNGVWLEGLHEFMRGHDVYLAERYERIIDFLCTKVPNELGGHWRLFPARSYFRRVTNANVTRAMWHTDVEAAALPSIKGLCTNFWIPLDAVGDDLPSLQIVPNSHRTIKESQRPSPDYPWYSDEFVENLGQIITPRLNPGDALVFDRYTLHRTQPILAPRTACEFRFISDKVAYTYLYGIALKIVHKLKRNDRI